MSEGGEIARAGLPGGDRSVSAPVGWLRLLAAVTAAVTVAVAAVVLTGWHLGIAPLVQVSTDFAPVQYNTAVCFVLCGLGLFAATFAWNRAAVICSTLVFVVALFSAAEYALGLDFGIDQLLFESTITTQTSHPGRMAPNTALCFMLVAAAIVMCTALQPRGWLRPAAITLAVASLSFSIVSLAGYVLHVEAAYGWGSLTRMALLAAISFVLISTGAGVFAWRQATLQRPSLASWHGWLVAWAGVTVTIALWQAIVAASDNAAVSYVMLAVGVVSSVLAGGTVFLLTLVQRKARDLEQAVARRDAAEQGLHLANNALASSASGVIITNGGRITYANAAFLRMFRFAAPEDVLDLNAAELFASEGVRRFSDVEALIAAGGDETEELLVTRKDGSCFTAQVAASTVWDSAGKIVGRMASFVDVSDRVAALAELEKRAEQLRRQRKAALSLAKEADAARRRLAEQTQELNDQRLAALNIAEDAEFSRQKAEAAEAALRESEAHVARAVAGTTDGMWDWEPATGRVWYAPRFFELLGYEPEEFPATFDAFQSRLHPEDLEATLEAVRLQLEEDRPYDVEYRLRTKSGYYRWFRARGKLHRDTDGRPQRFSGSIQDIEDLKRAEEKLERQVAETARLGVLASLNTAAQAVTAAESFGEALQIVTDKAREMIGAHLATTHFAIARQRRGGHSAHGQGGNAAEARSLSEKYAEYRDYDVEPNGLGIYRLITESNQPMRVTQEELESHPNYREFGEEKANHPPLRGWLAVPLISRAGKNLGFIQLSDKYAGEFDAEDEAILVQFAQFAASALEVQKANEELEHRVKQRTAALEAVNEELRRSNEDLERFAYVSSHDLQEPLRAVSGYCQLLEQQYGKQFAGDGLTYMQHIVEGAARMQQLIKDLLAYSRITRRGADFAATDIRAVIEDVLRDLRLTIEETGAVVHYEDLPTIHADEQQLRQLLQNLIGNSLKYHGPAPPEITITAEEEAQRWHFTVTDNGIGIDPKFRDRIFVIFQRLHTRDEYPGTGIGLAVCKRIVERHGGEIWVTENPAGGSCFQFTISKRLSGAGYNRARQSQLSAMESLD